MHLAEVIPAHIGGRRETKLSQDLIFDRLLGDLLEHLPVAAEGATGGVRSLSSNIISRYRNNCRGLKKVFGLDLLY